MSDWPDAHLAVVSKRDCPYVKHHNGQRNNPITGGTATEPAQIVVGLMLIESGLLAIVVPPVPTPRNWEEEEAADRERASALSDEWLQEMEQFAQANWERPMG